MGIISIILFILGFIEIGAVIYYFVKYWNTKDCGTAVAGGVLVYTHFLCAVVYFSLGAYLNGWLVKW